MEGIHRIIAIASLALMLAASTVSSLSDAKNIKELLSRRAPQDPEVYMDATELITSKGYPCENHWITTEDGYILNLIRIPYGRHSNGSSPTGERPVVVLQHGLEGSASNFITNLANQSLAFVLADAGADVWMGNSRGNTYSTNHTHLNPKHDRFWQFSWDEMAKYDLPAMIKYILKASRVEQVYYVGHSQGTTIAFAQLGEDAELASHIKHFFAMAPVALTTHSKTPLNKLAPYAQNISVFYNTFFHGKVNLNDTVKMFLAEHFCTEFGAMVCTSTIFILCGYDFKSFNVSRIPVYVAHSPAGTSVNTFLHWAQSVNSGKFQKFDYGSERENKRRYGQMNPPQYNPSNIKVPVTLMRGGEDWMSSTEDAQWLLSQLPNVADVFIPHYAHLDFIWAVDASKLLYDKMIKTIFS